jgi:hypothetical protein
MEISKLQPSTDMYIPANDKKIYII